MFLTQKATLSLAVVVAIITLPLCPSCQAGAITAGLPEIVTATSGLINNPY